MAGKRGRPRKRETALSRWLDRVEMTRDEFAERLGVTRPYVDHLCRGSRRPSLELAFKIEKLTKRSVTAAALAAAPVHSED